MPHQCVKCSRVLPIASRELLEGCADCGSKFFFYVREEQLESAKNKIVDIPEIEIKKIEKDVRDMAGVKDDDAPVILDFESVRATGEGKFELDLSKLFDRKKPVVYQVEEGKYMIDIARTMERSKDLE